MNSLGIMVMPARDGGLVVYESVGADSEIVFCGDQKAVNEYIAKRVGELKADKSSRNFEETTTTRRVYGNPNNAVELFAVEA